MRAIDISAINRLPAIIKRIGSDSPEGLSRAEFIAYIAAIADDYWEQALEAEDNDPALTPANERIGDFIEFLHINKHMNED